MSVELPGSSDVISPTTRMNNSGHMAVDAAALPQHDAYMQGVIKQEPGGGLGMGMGLGMPQHGANGWAQQAHSSGSGDAGMMPAGAGCWGSAAPGAPGDALASHPLATADSLLSQGSTDLGLAGGLDAAAAAAMPVPDMPAGHVGSSFGSTHHHGSVHDLPPLGTSSPPLPGLASPGLSAYGGGSGSGANNCSADSMMCVQQQLQLQQQPHTHSGALGPGGHHLPGHGAAQQPLRLSSSPPLGSHAQPRGASNGSGGGGGRGSGGGSSTAAAAAAAAAAGDAQQPLVFRSQYRGVSYDKKKRKWRVQIKVAALGKSGVSVGYFDTEDAAARAYDRAAIGLLGRNNCKAILNFPIEEYDHDSVPELVGKSREEVKATLKSERAKLPRRRLTNRRRTSRYLGVGSSNRKNQWQARILYHGKVTHLGYYRTEEEAARVYDKVSISLHGAGAQTNFPIDQYKQEVPSLQQKLSGLTREELQRALGVKPMDKSSRFRGVSRKKGRWEAKVMLNRKWAYRELFDSETDAAHAYDAAVWRLKPRDARNYANFKDSCPPDVAELLGSIDKLELHPTGLPLTAAPLIEAGLLYDDEGCSIRAPDGLTRSVSIGELISLGDSAQAASASEPSAGNGSGSAGRPPALSGDGAASSGATGAVAGRGGEGGGVVGGLRGMVKSASYSALSGLEAGAVTSSLVVPTDPAAAAAAPVPLSALPPSRGGLRGELSSHHMLSAGGGGGGFGQQHGAGSMQHSHHGLSGLQPGGHHFGGGGGGGGMPRVQSVPHLRSWASDAGSPTLPPLHGGAGVRASAGGAPGGGMAGTMGGGGLTGVYGSSSGGLGMEAMHQQQQQQQQAWGGAMPQQLGQPQQLSAFAPASMVPKVEDVYGGWHAEQLAAYQQQQQHQRQHQGMGMRASRSCGNLAFMGAASSSLSLAQPGAHHSPGLHSPRAANLHGAFSSGSTGAADFGAGSAGGDAKPLMVRVGSETHLLNPMPTGFKGMSRIASEGHLSSMVPLSPTSHASALGHAHSHGSAGGGFGGFGGGGMMPQAGMAPGGGPGHAGLGMQHGLGVHHGGMGMLGTQPLGHPQQQLQQLPQAGFGMGGSGFGGSVGSPVAAGGAYAGGQQQQQQPGFGMPPPGPSQQQQQQQQQQQAAAAAAAAAGGAGAGGEPLHRVRRNSSSLNRVHSSAALDSIDEMGIYTHQGQQVPGAVPQPGLALAPPTLAQPPGSGGGGRMDAATATAAVMQLGTRTHALPGSLAGLAPSGLPGLSMGGGGGYLAPQQPQPQQGLLPMPTGLPYSGGGAALSPMEQQQQQQQLGQLPQQACTLQLPPGTHSLGAPPQQAAAAYHAAAGGAAGPGGPAPQAGAGFGAGGGTPSPGSAAAAAAAFGAMSGPAGDAKGWADAFTGAQPDSPLGAVQIGGEELDVTMAFLTDGSPTHRRLSEAGGLDISSMLADPSGPRPHSPSHSNPALMYGGAALAGGIGGGGGGADAADGMDE